MNLSFFTIIFYYIFSFVIVFFFMIDKNVSEILNYRNQMKSKNLIILIIKNRIFVIFVIFVIQYKKH